MRAVLAKTCFHTMICALSISCLLVLDMLTRKSSMPNIASKSKSTSICEHVIEMCLGELYCAQSYDRSPASM